MPTCHVSNLAFSSISSWSPGVRAQAELDGTGVGVTCIYPGTVESRRNNDRAAAAATTAPGSPGSLYGCPHCALTVDTVLCLCCVCGVHVVCLWCVGAVVPNGPPPTPSRHPDSLAAPARTPRARPPDHLMTTNRRHWRSVLAHPTRASLPMNYSALSLATPF